MTDEEILFLCKEANDETVRRCVEILAKRYQTAIVNYIYKIIRDREAAEDLTQETFVRVFNKSREFKRVAKFSTWLYKIATNLSLNEIRDRKIRPSLSLYSQAESDSAGELISLLPARQVPTETDSRRRELARLIEKTLQELPEKYRLVLILCDIEQFSYQEAARVLGMRVGTVGSRLSRARRYFVEKFRPHIADSGSAQK
jgi:RNA polymerase sigma-70 factor (ECF subfamily)